jgi:hypothetical protein
MDLRDAAREQCDFSGIFHRYIIMGDSAKLALCDAAQLTLRQSVSAPPRSSATGLTAVDYQLRPVM